MKIADMHCDTISKIYRARRRGEEACLRSNGFSVSLEGMREAGFGLQFFACFVDMAEYDDPYGAAMGMIDVFDGEMEANGDIIGRALCFDDIERNEQKGLMSALLTIEEGGVFGGSMERLREAYDRGVRLVTLTWNYENELGYPNRMDGGSVYGLPQTELGLKERGIEFVREMERLHMIVDVSHLGDAGFYDVAAHTKKPFAASHSNARAVTGNVRNLTDDMIKILAERGGITGINFCPVFLREGFTEEEQCVSCIDDMVRHALHIRDVGGIEVLGLGSDLDGIGGRLEIDRSEKLPLLGEALHSGGFSYDETDLIMYKNVMRFARDVMPRK